MKFITVVDDQNDVHHINIDSIEDIVDEPSCSTIRLTSMHCISTPITSEGIINLIRIAEEK